MASGYQRPGLFSLSFGFSFSRGKTIRAQRNQKLTVFLPRVCAQVRAYTAAVAGTKDNIDWLPRKVTRSTMPVRVGFGFGAAVAIRISRFSGRKKSSAADPTCRSTLRRATGTGGDSGTFRLGPIAAPLRVPE
jgi:hypothetical protein